MIPAACRAHFYVMDGKFQPFSRNVGDFPLAARASSAPPQRIAVYPVRQAQALAADRACLVHVHAVVFGSGSEKKVRVTELVPAQLSRLKVAQVLGAFPLIGDFVAALHML